jgi:hypothetical protein
MCGLPGGYPDDLIDVDIDALTEPDGDRVIRISNADYLDRQLRLTPIEATAVIVALRALRGGAVSVETKEVVDRTLAKLEQAAAEGAAASVDPGEELIDTSLVQIHAAIATAIDQGRQVRIDYWVPPRRRAASASTGSGAPRCSTPRWPPIRRTARAPRMRLGCWSVRTTARSSGCGWLPRLAGSVNTIR